MTRCTNVCALRFILYDSVNRKWNGKRKYRKCHHMIFDKRTNRSKWFVINYLRYLSFKSPVFSSINIVCLWSLFCTRMEIFVSIEYRCKAENPFATFLIRLWLTHTLQHLLEGCFKRIITLWNTHHTNLQAQYKLHFPNFSGETLNFFIESGSFALKTWPVLKNITRNDVRRMKIKCSSGSLSHFLLCFNLDLAFFS